MEILTHLITGATDGVGKATAVKLALQGHKVIIAGRDEDKIQRVIKEIYGFYKHARLDFIQADLSDLTQVEVMIGTIKSRYNKLDVLINNAGVVTPRFKLTCDRFENTYQVNYLSPFILTNALLPLIERSSDGRIINVVSNVYSMGRFDAEYTSDDGEYNAIRAYANSKLHLLMFTEELARRTDGKVTVKAMHPGIVKTNMSTQLDGYPLLFRIISFLAMPFAITPEKAADLALSLATGNHLGQISGSYVTSSGVKEIKHKDDTYENRQWLWAHSMDIWEKFKQKAWI